MKKCCKNMDITDAETIAPFIFRCLKRHGKRRDFQNFIKKEGIPNGYLLEDTARVLAEKISCMIKERTIPPLKVWATRKYDESSRKVRLIGDETVLQLLLDYIAVYGCAELWKRKLVREQCSSIPGRGQLYGAKLLRRYVKKDNYAMRYAKAHHLRYTRKCKYFVKLDVRHCYEFIDRELLMSKFERDIGNCAILYLWKSLLKSYESVTNGLLIGALPSQFASQYVMVNLYRHAMENKSVTHMVMYMDDMVLFSPNRRKLLKATKDLITYARDELHLTIKPNFAIKRLSKEPLDMMGYVIHGNGKVTIRAKAFIHARRLVKRYEMKGTMSFSQARRLACYKGYFIHSACHGIEGEYFKAIRAAQKIVSERTKLWNG